MTGQPIEIAIGPPLFQRLPVGREAAGEDADDRERDREVGEAAPAAVQLLLVAQLGEPLLVRAQRAGRSPFAPSQRKWCEGPSLARALTVSGRSEVTRWRTRRPRQLCARLASRRGAARRGCARCPRLLAHHARGAGCVVRAQRAAPAAGAGRWRRAAPPRVGDHRISAVISPCAAVSPRSAGSRRSPRRARRAGGRRPGGRR